MQTRYQRTRTMAKALEHARAQNKAWQGVADRQYSIIKMQASLLSDASDIFEQVGLSRVWHNLIDRYVPPSRLIVDGQVAVYENDTPAAVAHQREAHDTITAQSGL